MKKLRKKKTLLITSPKGLVIDNSGSVENHFHNDINIDSKTIYFLMIFLLIIVILLVILIEVNKKKVMTGEFRIAIAGFYQDDPNLPKNIGDSIADMLFLRLEKDLQDITAGPYVEIWGPEQVGTIKGKTIEERAYNADELAKKINAHMIIYGTINNSSNNIEIIPEFYLTTLGFSEGNELIGQYDLDLKSNFQYHNNPSWNYTFDNQMLIKSDIISSLAVGLSYYATKDYENALLVFQDISNLDKWSSDNGKNVIYALLGFTAGKLSDYDMAEQYLEKSISLNPEYSRPYIGMANIQYMRALSYYDDPSIEIEDSLYYIESCFEYSAIASKAPYKPPLAEIETKIHFSQGQCYFLKSYLTGSNDYDIAIDNFNFVITKFDDDTNERIIELAAESHARLGLIYQLNNNYTYALDEYKIASLLSQNNSERQELFDMRIEEITQLLQ